MAPDLTLEVIYLNNVTDFKMEFDICGSCNLRFLSHISHSKESFITALGKSVVRSRVTVAVGSLNVLDNDYLPKIIAKATGYNVEPVDKEKFNIVSNGDLPIPTGSIPLVSSDGILGGCVMENNDQSIIILTSDREIRNEIVTNLICPYLGLIAGKKSGASVLDNNKSISNVKSAPEGENQIPLSENGNIQSLAKGAEQGEISKPAEIPDSTEEFVSKALQQTESEEPDSKKNEGGDSGVIVAEKSDANFIVLEQPENTLPESYDLKDLLATEQTKNGTAKRTIRAVVSVLLVFSVLCSAYFGYELVYQPMQYKSVMEEIVSLYGQTWAELPQNMQYKFGKLYQINSDIVGWLSIPETNIKVPVVSSANKTENYYRTHLFEGSVSSFGTPFTYSDISENTYSRNIVIYGKGEGENNLFSDIKKFLNFEKYKQAPVISFDTVYLGNRWKIFAVYTADKMQLAKEIKSSFFNDEAFLDYTKDIINKSEIKTNIDIIPEDEILTIVSEEELENTVLVARKVRDGEAPLVNFDKDIQTPDTGNKYESTFSDNSSAPLQEITESSSSQVLSNKKTEEEKNAEQNVADNGTSRYEQTAPTSSNFVVKPTSSKPVSTYSSNNSAASENISNNSGLLNSSNRVSSNNLSGLSSVGATSSNNALSSTSSNGVQSGNSTSSSTLPLPQNMPVLTVTNAFNGAKVSGKANEIIAQILEAEMGSSYHIEALKAQAVAAYSWLLCNGSAAGAYPSAPLKKAGARAIQAANSVAGTVALYNGEVAQTFYYAISAGKTANSDDIWSARLPYLVSVDSSVDKNVNGYQTIRKFSSSDVASFVKESLGINLNTIYDKSKWFKCVYDANGIYVKNVYIGASLQKGTYLRDKLFTADRVGAGNVLRSSAYTISYNAAEDKFIFTVKGYGHGVGMSQVGANAYANNGWTYDKILKHYYTGITLGTYLG